MSSAYDGRVLTTLEALDDGLLRDELKSWLVTLSITLFAFGLRFYNFWLPQKILFDETFYAKDAWAILVSGYERNWAKDVNEAVAQGDLSGMQDTAQFIAHPPLGKLIIAVGEWLFGMNAFGWRFMSVVFGSLLVMLTIRLARRLSRSTLIGALAGVLLTFDGLAFVMSRIALLDIFQAVFSLAAVAALVADRDWFRHRLADHLRANNLLDLGGKFGPAFLWRPWRLAAGVLFGLACAVKWNSVFLLAVFGIVAVCWDLGARRLAGAGKTIWQSLLRDGVAAFGYLVVVAIPVYLATWFRWLGTSGGYYRDWGETHPDEALVQWFGKDLGALFYYHQQIYGFHVSDRMMVEAEHTYEAHPAGWLLLLRPIGIEAVNGIEPGQEGCEAIGTTCLRVISGIGTPILWWTAVVAIALALGWWLICRDWRFAVPLLAIGSTWLPWFKYTDRPLFFFYAIMIIPFSVTILAMALGKLLGPAQHPKRMWRAMVVGVFVALVILNFAFFYPILTADLLTRNEWLMRMWLGNAWI